MNISSSFSSNGFQPDYRCSLSGLPIVLPIGLQWCLRWPKKLREKSVLYSAPDYFALVHLLEKAQVHQMLGRCIHKESFVCHPFYSRSDLTKDYLVNRWHMPNFQSPVVGSWSLLSLQFLFLYFRTRCGIPTPLSLTFPNSSSVEVGIHRYQVYVSRYRNSLVKSYSASRQLSFGTFRPPPLPTVHH